MNVWEELADYHSRLLKWEFANILHLVNALPKAIARGRALERVAEATQSEILGNNLIMDNRFIGIRKTLAALDASDDAPEKEGA